MKKKVKTFSDTELCDIMHSYLVLNKTLYNIHSKMSDRCTLNHLHKVVSHAVLNKQIIIEVLCIKVPIDNCLSYKNESYWKSEEDVLFNPITFNELSESEKLIYYGVK